MVVNKEILEFCKRHNIFILEYFILYSKYVKNQWLKKSPPLDRSFNKLKRIGFLDSKSSLTTEGKRAMDNMIINIAYPEQDTRFDEQFDAWWEIYPRDDSHSRWPSTRLIRTNKARAKKLYAEICEAKESTPSKLISALELDMKRRKKNSMKQNEMRFMKAPATWLYQREFEGLLELEDNQQENLNDYGKSLN